jgi:predicted SAM-dependent methyltransferase
VTLSLRSRKITAALHLHGKGLEYGPLHRTLLPKPSFDVVYADYADRDHLVAHYAGNPNVDPELIPDIDIVTGGSPVTQFVAERSLDYVVASHVMEHVPDLLGWLDSNLRILKPGGRLALAVPDKRYCFDIRRQSSTVSEIMAAYLEKRTRPSFSQICDHFWNVCTVLPAECWQGKTTAENAEYIHSREDILQLLKSKLDSPEYTDCHCWIFTDSELLAILGALKPYAGTRFDVVSFYPTQPGTLEFYVTLERA